MMILKEFKTLLIEILTQIGSTAFALSVVAYLGKTWIEHQLNKVSEKNSHELERQVAKLNVHESYLHKRRVEIIEEMYKKALDAEFSLQNFLVTWWGYWNKESLLSSAFPEKGAFSKKRGMEFCEAFTEINAMLHKNALYFSDQFIDGVRNSYEPYFQLILDMDEFEPPPFPEDFVDIIRSGQKPRRSMISLFRKALGVEC